jgi:hypothetical protein
MQQKTLIAVGALLVLGILAVLTLRAPEKGERTGPRPRPIAALKAADIKELDMTSGGGKDHIVMKLDNGSWKIAAPTFQTPQADQSLMKTAVEQLEKLSWGDLVTQKKEKQAELEVSDDRGAHVVAKDAAGKVLFDGWIGKSASGFTMVRPAGSFDKGEAWQATGLFKYTYAREAKAWRDHTILDFNKDDASRLAVEHGGEKLVLEKVTPPAPDKDKPEPNKAKEEARWRVVDANVKVDPLDDTVANSMIVSMSTLKAADFDESTKPVDAGLAPPRYRVTATVKGQPMTLLVGNVKGDDSWVQVDGRSQIYLLRKYMLDRLAQKPIDFRDKTIVKAKEDDLTAIEVSDGSESYSLERAGSEWKLGKGKGTLDATKVKPVASAFEDLKGTGFAEASDAKTTGLAKPSATVTLRLRDKSAVTLRVGGKSADGTDEYVQRAGSPDVLVVKKYMVDRFVKKLADLTKK